MGKTVLFFYGSLKRGYSNHHRVRGEFLGEVVTEPRYRIIELGQYGGLIRDSVNGVAVKGELWAVDAECLAELDEFETGEGLWARFPVDVQGHVGSDSYFWTGDVPADVRSSDFWPFG
jgi:gamma-glutamylaminecyclotransferase